MATRTTKAAVAGGIAGALAVAAFAGASATGIAPFAAASVTTPTIPAPQNLRAYEIGRDYVKVSFGPSIVGPFKNPPEAAANGRSVTVRWGATTDALFPTGPFTYDYYKNGKLVWSGRNQTWANVGITLKVRQFSTCVVPHSPNGFGPKRCTTWTAPS